MQPSHRRIIVISGPQEWCQRAACTLLEHHPHDDIVWIGDAVPAPLAITPFARRQQWLGDEYGIAVIDAWSGFDPDQFGAVSGTVRGGGALLLLLPPLDEWAARPDPAQQRIAVWPHTPKTLPNHFIERVIRILQHHSAVEWVTQTESLPAALHIGAMQTTASPAFRTTDQQQAIAAIHHVVHGHRRRPLVLMADRGRGKSTALGIAAAELLAQGVQRIIVTAPHRNAVSSLFEHAIGTDTLKGTRAPPAERFVGGTSAPNAALQFIPPDELLRRHYPCDLLLVDEAAAIPAPMLEQLLQRHARIVFATTVHGYEGSGRGFALRFFKVLDQVTPGWHLLEMNEPIRWAASDPLEQLTYDLLLLDAAPAADEVIAAASAEDIHFETIASSELNNNEALLTELFGLLVLAHYRTTPLDLRQLLDSPNLSIHVARYQNHVVGTAITLREGGFDDELAAQIYSGSRRPRGHLAPQSLAFHCGMHDAPLLVTERIMRIAVHPAVQQRGIGSALIEYVTSRSRNNSIDYLSTSFGATRELLQFWQRSHFLPVRIGLTREASSGHHSALLLRPLSPAAMALFARARRRFINYLPLQLGDPLRDLDTELAAALLSGQLSESTPYLDEDDWRDLNAFITTHRSYESCLGAIHKLTREVAASPWLMEELTPGERQLLIARVLQQRSWEEVIETCEINGKDAAVKLMRRAIQHILYLH
jgi:tRNA(Met) cytidine acetyltransferase